ncbi:MAG: HlyD family secretion protein [Pseudomonas veronii]|nr:HlyD family secretion protein [Pseudomonas veronii]
MQGRVLYRLVNPGEVVSAGGKVLTIIDLSEIYMEIYLPSEQAMRVTIGVGRTNRVRRCRLRRAGQSEFRVAGRAVHAQAGRDAQRTRQAYVPGQAAHSARASSRGTSTK